jgi:hypothetical protein
MVEDISRATFKTVRLDTISTNIEGIIGDPLGSWLIPLPRHERIMR